MATFHLDIRSRARAKGANAVAAASYISRSKLRDEQQHRTYDYRRRGGLVHAAILTPERAGEHSQTPVPERQALWNLAERAERQRNARVAREYEVSLPHELKAEDRIALARRFAQDIANRYGSAVDLAVHNPPPGGDPRNVHAHVLATTREYHDGGLGKKTTIERNYTARKALGLPSSRIEYKQIRARWAEFANEALREHGFEANLDSRSLAEQGINRRPQRSRGIIATAILRRGGRSTVEDRIRAEERAMLEQERASISNQRSASLDSRRRRALESWRSYREQGRSAGEEAQREREDHDHGREPAGAPQRDFER